MPVELTVRPAVPTDAEAIAVIYNQGIEDRIAAFETETRDGDARRRWLDGVEVARLIPENTD